MNDQKDYLLNETKTGRYFQDALDWYCDKYLFCTTERAWLTIISLFLCFILCSYAANIYSLFPIKHDFSLIKYTDRYTDEFSVMKKLSTNTEESEQFLISKYLVGQYVEKYESYNYQEIPNQLNFIKNNSSRKVYLNFKNMMSPNNITSPIMKYRTDTMVIISTQSVEIINNNKAIVKFITYKMTKGGGVKEQEAKTAQISFTLSNIRMSVAGIMPLEFVVNDYQTVDR